MSASRRTPKQPVNAECTPEEDLNRMEQPLEAIEVQRKRHRLAQRRMSAECRWLSKAQAPIPRAAFPNVVKCTHETSAQPIVPTDPYAAQPNQHREVRMREKCKAPVTLALPPAEIVMQNMNIDQRTTTWPADDLSSVCLSVPNSARFPFAQPTSRTPLAIPCPRVAIRPLRARATRLSCPC